MAETKEHLPGYPGYEAGGRLPSGRHRLSREFVVRSQRDRLLEAAATAAADNGYPALTVAEICKRANVSRRTFYELFADKEECLLAAYDAIAGRFLADVIAACQIEGITWAEQIRLGLEAILDYFAENPRHAKLCLIEVWAAGPKAVERYYNAANVLASFIDAGRGTSPYGAMIPAATAGATFNGCAFALARHVLDGEAERLPELLPDLLHMVLVPYLGFEAAERERERARELLAERQGARSATGAGRA